MALGQSDKPNYLLPCHFETEMGKRSGTGFTGGVAAPCQPEALVDGWGEQLLFSDSRCASNIRWYCPRLITVAYVECSVVKENKYTVELTVLLCLF